MHKISIASFLLASLLISLMACNRGTAIKKSITYQNDIMKVELFERVDGKVLKNYKQEINVAGLNKEEREALGKKVFDSLAALPNFN